MQPFDRCGGGHGAMAGAAVYFGNIRMLTSALFISFDYIQLFCLCVGTMSNRVEEHSTKSRHAKLNGNTKLQISNGKQKKNEIN